MLQLSLIHILLSNEGREITLYRLFDMDICLLSASCIIRSIQFEVTIEAEKDTDLWIIPAEIYKDIMKESAPVANYTNELMAVSYTHLDVYKRQPENIPFGFPFPPRFPLRPKARRLPPEDALLHN